MRYATANGPALRALRKKRKLTLGRTAAQLAEILNRPVHITTLSKVEKGQRQPSDELFDAWCEVLAGEPNKLSRPELPPDLANRVGELVSAALATSYRSGAA